ncbi:MAG: serine/threonine protein kinase [Polyangiaceae bacterium]|nr:serine/threonine protein kinase [Polyangiaceae bacterium]
MPLLPGVRISPNVTLVRPLRKGGMASVWVAEHAGLATQVAVKFLSPELAADPASVARFSREAAAAAQVKSPHVVQMLDHGVTDDGFPFLVMELLDGEELTRRFEGGPLPPPFVARVVAQVARALGKAHEKGIVHRDIKPDNIFLVDAGGGDVFVKLLDFGIAKGGHDVSATSGTTQGALFGTPHYMSPEQAIGARDVDFRSDLWSLGMVAFEALTGRRAVEGETLGALVLEIHTSDLPAPSSANPQLSRAVDEWFFKACTRDKLGRFESARAMADALLSATGARTSAPPPPPDATPRSEVPTLSPPSLRPPEPPKRARTTDDGWKDDVDRSNRVGLVNRAAPRAEAARAPLREAPTSAPVALAPPPRVGPELPAGRYLMASLGLLAATLAALAALGLLDRVLGTAR